jgi:hypothetical protein
MQGIISFSDRVAFNIKSNDHKDIILDQMKALYDIKILQRHHHNLDNNNINFILSNHLMNLRSNGNRYYLYFTLYNNIETMYFIDKKIHPGYQRPRIIFGRGLFDKKLFKNTLLDGEMVKCKDNTWSFLINDIICYEGTYLNRKMLPERLKIIYNMLETQYTPDETIDVCNYKVKRYFNMCKEAIETIMELSSNLNYTCRGIYICPYDFKYKPKLYNFDESSVINVVRKTKDITEFNSGTGGALATAAQSQASPQAVAASSQAAAPQAVAAASQAAAAQAAAAQASQASQAQAALAQVALAPTVPTVPTTEEKILYIVKTNEPDIYNVYDNEDVLNKPSIGIALVQTLSDSKLLRNSFRDKNAITNIKFACVYVDKFKKWRAVRQV